VLSVRGVFHNAAPKEGAHENKRRECDAKKDSRQQIQSECTKDNDL
jgi:hypothetical protein